MMLAVRNIEFGYAGSEKTLSGISLEARGGEVLGLLGPNGSGKSTLLKLMCGMLRPQAGEVLLNGAPVHALRPRALARALSLVPQSATPPEGFTALDVVLMGRHAYIPRLGRESGRDVEIAREAMERTGVETLSEREARALSGGEWQRVLIARALAQEAGVLLLDEPVANLDIRYQLEILRLLRALAAEGARRGAGDARHRPCRALLRPAGGAAQGPPVRGWRARGCAHTGAAFRCLWRFRRDTRSRVSALCAGLTEVSLAFPAKRGYNVRQISAMTEKAASAASQESAPQAGRRAARG